MKKQNKFRIALTEKQINVLLAIIDCSTNDDESDWFLHDDGKIRTPCLNNNGNKYRCRTVQHHLDKMLKKKMFPFMN